MGILVSLISVLISAMVSLLRALIRLLVPRSARRVMHPVRTMKRAVTPKPIKTVQRAMHPVASATYVIERSLTTPKAPAAKVYRHGNCPVKHRSYEAAMNCRNR